MSNSIFQIGISGLNAADYELTTTSENIANASTAGYDDESVQIQEAAGQYTGGGFLGTGVDVQTVTRAYSQYLTNQLNQATSQSSALTANSTQLTQIDDTLGNPTAGLTTTLDNFFTSLQSVASDPSSTSTRSAFLGDAQTLVTQVNGVAQQLATINTNVNTQIASTVTQINTYANEIAQLNNQIEASYAGSGNTQEPNNLLDQRDQAIANLSSLIGTSVVSVSGGGENVFIGNGQALVLGGQTYALSAVNSPSNPSQSVVAYQYTNSSTSSASSSTVTEYLPQNTLTGGTLGGLLQFRTDSLVPTQNSINTIASAIAGAVNTQNELGLTLDNAQGGALFSTAAPTVITNSQNTGSATVSVTIANASNPPSDNYTLSYASNEYTITDQTTGASETFPSNSTFPVTEFGLNINISGTPNNGDSFNIQPTANAAGTLALTTTNPVNVAAAAPILASASTSNQGSATISQGTVDSNYFSQVITSALSTNTGNATISTPTVSAAYAAQALTAPVTLTYSGGDLTGFPANTSLTVTSDGTTTTYNTGTTTSIPLPTGGAQISFNGLTFNITGTPADNDEFVVSPNAPLTSTTTLTYNSTTGDLTGFPTNDVVTATITAADGTTTTTTYAPPATTVPYAGAANTTTTYSFGGVSVTLKGTADNNDTFTIKPNDGDADGRNALALSNLSTADLLNGGTQSITGTYSVLVAQVGSELKNVQVSSTSAQALVTQFTTQQQSVSGVNLDQEASNLLQYQQLYEANSKVIQIASSLFDTILAIQ